MHDHGLDTVVAGVSCREVLADLSGFLDGELTTDRVAQLQAHLNGCDRCAQFGGSVAQMLTQLRAGLGVPSALSTEASARLHARVTDAMRG